MDAYEWKKSLAIVALLTLLFAPLFSVIQFCYANPGVTVNLSQSSGPIGLTVTVSGQLENPGAEFKIFWQYIRDWDGCYGFLASGYAIGYNYAANITIPPAVACQHYVIVEDEKNHATGYAVFTVTPEIAVQPDTAPSGAFVEVSGSLINGEIADIKFQDPASGDETLVAQALTDNVTGEFSCSFKVPLYPEGSYAVRAYWSGVLQAEAPFQIGYQGMFVNPDKAPSGAIVNVYGGLAINETLIIAFKNSTWSVDVATVQTDQSGQFSVNVSVPQADPGNYTVAALNHVGRAEVVSVPFTVPPPAQITASSDAANPNEALPSYSKIIVQGQNFIADENVTIYFENALVKVAEATTDSNGTFTAEFTVPADASAGVHTITAVQDPYNVSASTTITVHNVTIKPYAQLYVPGDTIAFYVNSTTPFTVPGEIVANVFDPNGIPYTPQGYHMNTGYDIVQVKGFYVAPYDRLAFWPDIPKGAPVGIWTWNAAFSLQLYPGVQFNTSGVFYVIPEPDLNYIIQRLNEIDAKIDGLVYKQDQLYLLIQTNHNAVMARLDQLEANLASITTSGFAQINTLLGEVAVKLDMLNAQITDVRNSVVMIQTSLGTMTADVSAIKDMLSQVDAKITSIADGVVQIKTSVGTLTAKLDALDAKLTSVENGVATINTAIGNLTAKLDGINASIIHVQGDVAAVSTAVGNLAVKLDALAANLTGLIVDGKGEVLAKIDTALGVVTAKLDAVNATITGVSGSVARIETAVGEVEIQLKELEELFANSNLTITSLIVNSKGEVIAKIDAGNAELNAKLDALNALVASVGEGVATVNTVIGELNVSLADLKANVTALIINSENKVIVEMQTLLGPVNATLVELGGKITSINGNVANVLVPGLGEVKALVVDAKGASENASQAVSGMNTLIYAVIAISIVAAALSAVNFLTVRRRIAPS